MRDARPGALIDAAAKCSADDCDPDPEGAFRVNAEVTFNLAVASGEFNTQMVYVCRVYVFDGEMGAPHLEADPPNPLNTYGRSKLAGETVASKGRNRPGSCTRRGLSELGEGISS